MDGDRFVEGGCVAWDVVGEADVVGIIADSGGWRERNVCECVMGEAEFFAFVFPRLFS